MGYRIEYNGAVVKRKKVHISRRIVRRISAGVAAVLMTAILLWPAGRRCVRDILLPGDEDVTAAALSGLVEDLSAGKPVGEAVHTFCVEIVAGDA